MAAPLPHAVGGVNRGPVQVWIANEENSKVLGIGVDELVKRGYLKHLLPGTLFCG